MPVTQSFCIAVIPRKKFIASISSQNNGYMLACHFANVICWNCGCIGKGFAKVPGQLIYHPQVQAAAQRCPGLHVRYFAEQDSDGTDCLPGKIEAETVFGSVPEPLSLTYYLAGPPGMVQALTQCLIQRGLPPGQIVAEAWE